MASTVSFVNFIVDQIDGAYFKKMFGEYGVYLEGKMILLICDDTLFVKPSEKIENILKSRHLAPPYNGAKDYYVISELEDKEYLNMLAKIKFDETPYPKPRKLKNKN
ncbi:TfoX/Sxy family protein [Acholeplasma sp. OttesenSCG-928-E16]|nr:TfoX/Sxy family protein [Acholeplasma sp. OttesenSCG-928-E16]